MITTDGLADIRASVEYCAGRSPYGSSEIAESWQTTEALLADLVVLRAVEVAARAVQEASFDRERLPAVFSAMLSALDRALAAFWDDSMNAADPGAVELRRWTVWYLPIYREDIGKKDPPKRREYIVRTFDEREDADAYVVGRAGMTVRENPKLRGEG